MLGKKTVDGVVASLKKMMDDLDEVYVHHSKEVARLDAVITEARDRQGASEVERTRAVNVKTRITELLGL